MSGAIPPLPQYALMAWCLVKAQGQLYLLPFRNIAPRILNPGTGWKCTVSFTPRPLYPRDWMCPRTSLDAAAKRKNYYHCPCREMSPGNPAECLWTSSSSYFMVKSVPCKDLNCIPPPPVTCKGLRWVWRQLTCALSYDQCGPYISFTPLLPPVRRMMSSWKPNSEHWGQEVKSILGSAVRTDAGWHIHSSQ
jgi:hypothetical protein